MNETEYTQQVLAGAGYWKGPQNGKWSNELSNALAKFQEEQHLTATGVLDLATKARFGNIINYVSGNAGQGGTGDPRIREEAIKRYGPGFAVYLDHPELGPIIAKGALENRDLNWLKGQLQGTTYWKTTQESARAWEELKVTDPASAQGQLNAAYNRVRDMAGTLGLSLGEAQLRRIADDSMAFGWESEMLSDVLVNTLRFDPAAPEPTGDVGSTMADLKELAAAQFLVLSDGSAFNYAKKILKGQANLDTYETMFRKQAKAKTPHLSDLIDDGVTLSEVFEQHKQRMANLLEVGADTIDFTNDKRWQPVMGYHDPETGKVRMMTETEAETYARQQTAYRTTANANEKVADLSTFLGQQFGTVASG